MMPRRPAILTQADVRRAIAGAIQAGATAVDIKPDGTIHCILSPIPTAPESEQPEKEREIVL